ncbi:MAG: hypothetical protein MI806_00715, partial [Minwuiales bacterium]|nr:hypothetical protein [Minwuiales bacterium]
GASCRRRSRKQTGTTALIPRAMATVMGLYLALTPLALWVAWSKQALLQIAGGTVAAAVLFLLCRWAAGDNAPADKAEAKRPSRIEPPHVSDAFLAELSNMGPWIYHNRLTAEPRFARKMARLRELLDEDR